MTLAVLAVRRRVENGSRPRDTRAPASRGRVRPRRARATRTPRRGCRPRCRPSRRDGVPSPPNAAAFFAVHSERTPTVVERRGERMLGREPVVDRHHDRARGVRDLARDRDRTARRCRSSSRRRGSTRSPEGRDRATAGTRAPVRRRRRGPRPRTRPRPRPRPSRRASRIRRALPAAARCSAGSSPAALTRSHTAWACGCNGITRSRAPRATRRPRRPRSPGRAA